LPNGSGMRLIVFNAVKLVPSPAYKKLIYAIVNHQGDVTSCVVTR
jgi:hypothetical protein